MTKRKVEILAPAGSYAAFEAALKAGADAVYAGGSRFGARAFADNFTEEELIRAIHEAHFHGRRLYLTLNTLLREQEINGLYEFLSPYYENGLDAVIVQDPGAVEYIRNCFPGLEIHASTQMTVTDVFGAKFAESQGMSRVVPARELSLDEIRKIRQETGLEIECFVHGALCYCYSGQCLLSSMIGGRSGNRGACAQPCRQPYIFEAASGNARRYYLSAKDICTLELIPDLVEAGIDSFKIEGRMKNPQYVAGVTAMYRKYTDLYLSSGKKGYRVQPDDMEILMDLYNRGGFSDGYYNKRNGRDMISLSRPNHAGVPAARIIRQKGREVTACALTGLSGGDVLEIAGDKNDYTLGGQVEKGARFSFIVRREVRLRPDAILYRIRNASLLERINEDVIGRKLQRPVSGLLTLRIGSPAILRINSGRFSCEARSADPVQKALKAPLTRERILAQIGKTGNSPFCFSAVSVESDEDIFLPVQQLTRLRHEAFGLLEEMIRNDALRPCGCRPSAEKQEEGAQAGERHPCYSVYTETPEQFSAAAGYIAATDKPAFSRICLGTEILSTAAFRKDDFYRDLDALRQRRCEIFAALPHVMRSGDQAQFERLFKRILRLDPDGVLVRNCGQFQYLKECGFDKKIILDHNLYVFNSYAAKFWWRLGADGFTAPLEADAGDISFLSGASLEYEVYGAAPVMVSAQCLFKTSGQCRRMPQSSGLKDRFGNIFPVRSYCDFCYNVIYDRRAERSGQDLAGNSGFRPYMRRIRFSTEKAEEVWKILGCFAN